MFTSLQNYSALFASMVCASSTKDVFVNQHFAAGHNSVDQVGQTVREPGNEMCDVQAGFWQCDLIPGGPLPTLCPAAAAGFIPLVCLKPL